MKEKFEKQFNCTNVPEQVVDFYNENNGKSLKINDIFSFETIVKEYNGFFKTFLSGGINHDSSAQYIPIANDGMGGYYAFVGNKDDENIYYFDHEFPGDEPKKCTIAEILENNDELE